MAGNTILLRFTGNTDDLRRATDDADKQVKKFSGSIVPLAATLGATGAAGGAAFAAIAAATVGAAAAMGGLGVAAAAQSEEVQSAFSGIGDGLMSAVNDASAAYVPLLTSFAGDLKAVIDGPVADSLSNGIAAAAPAVETALGAIPAVIETFLPVIDEFVGAGTPLLEMLAGGIVPAAEALAGSLTGLAPLVSENATALGEELGGAIPRILDSLGPLLAALVNLGGPVLNSLIPPVLGLAAAILEALAPTVEALTPTVTVLAEGLGQLITFLEPMAPLIIALGIAYAIWTAAQWALNIALTANPIGLIIVGIGALVAAIVWIATQTTWFQDAWRVSWDAISMAFTWTWDKIKAGFNWVRNNWGTILAILTGPIGIATKLIINNFDRIVSMVRSIPGRIRGAASGMWDGIKSAFRSALNWVIGRWNSLSFSLPSISAFGRTVGGGTFRVPRIPYFHSGTDSVPGAPGTEMLAMVQAGERIEPVRATGGNSGGELVLVVDSSSAGALERAVQEIVINALRSNKAVRTAVRG